MGRIHRVGQDRPVDIFNLAAEGTIEDYVLEILDRKLNMFELVIGEVDMILGQTGGRARLRGDRAGHLGAGAFDARS